MPLRKIVFTEGEYYHIFNKTIAHEVVFTKKFNLNRGLDLMNFYRFPSQMSYSHFRALNNHSQETVAKRIFSNTPLVDIFSFAYMENHYHFLVKQLRHKGISRFISNMQNSFAKFYNIKYGRDGALFKGMFEARRIENEEQLMHVSRYIHLNPVTAYLINIDDLDSYPYTSFPYYNSKQRKSFINTKLILSYFKKASAYKKFVYDQADYQRHLGNIKHLINE